MSSPPRRVNLAELLPREHGVWVQLGLPLIAVFLVGMPTRASWLLVLGILAAVVAHEPLLILVGRRGPARRRRYRRVALAWLAGLWTVGGIAALYALGSSALDVRLGATLPATLALGMFAIVALRLERSTRGELYAGIVFASASVPVALASAINPTCAVQLCLFWALVHAISIVCVRSSLGALPVGIAVTACILATVLCSIVGLSQGQVWPMAILPIVGLGLWTALHPSSRRQLARAGMVLLGGYLCTLAVLVAFPPTL